MFRKLVSSLTLVGFVSLILPQVNANQCHAIAFSGGGSIGSYEAGVVYGFNQKNPADFAWDVTTGVSAGALNAGSISLWDPKDGKAMSEWLVNYWLSLSNDQVYKDWPLGIVDALFNKSGIYDNSPLLNLMTKIFNEKGSFKRHVTVSAVDVNSGKYVTFDNSLPFADMPTAVVSSASIPFIFPNRAFKGYVLMDGGTAWNTNLINAVDGCKNQGFSDQDIVLDVVLCGDHQLAPEQDIGNAISNYLRYQSINSYYKQMNDIVEFKRSRPFIRYRYLVMPSGHVASGLKMIDFSRKNLEPMVELGKKDAASVMAMGEGAMFAKLDLWATMSEDERAEYDILDFVYGNTQNNQE